MQVNLKLLNILKYGDSNFIMKEKKNSNDYEFNKRIKENIN